MKINVPTYIKLISDKFKDSGFEIYLVGGCVRDSILGKTPKDYDLTTNALPDKIVEILEPTGWKFNYQGAKFGIIAVFGKGLPKEGVEIATFRSDLTKGRNLDVKMGVTIADDVARRDLTINALFYDTQKEEVVDLVGGLEDLKNGVIRMVGNPFERISEDNLRIPRLIRFSSVLGFKIDTETEKAVRNTLALEGVSMERIWDEFDKSRKVMIEFLTLSDKLGMLDKYFPGVKLNKEFVKSDNYLIYLSNLFKYNNPKNLSKVLVDLKMRRDTADKIEFLVRFLNFDAKNVYSFWKNFSNFTIYPKTLLEWSEINNIKEIGEKFIKFKPIHNSEELMKNGFKGKSLGDEILKIEENNFLNITI